VASAQLVGAIFIPAFLLLPGVVYVIQWQVFLTAEI
jgi:hypothetical protein